MQPQYGAKTKEISKEEFERLTCSNKKKEAVEKVGALFEKMEHGKKK